MIRVMHVVKTKYKDVRQDQLCMLWLRCATVQVPEDAL